MVEAGGIKSSVEHGVGVADGICIVPAFTLEPFSVAEKEGNSEAENQDESGRKESFLPEVFG